MHQATNILKVIPLRKIKVNCYKVNIQRLNLRTYSVNEIFHREKESSYHKIAQ